MGSITITTPANQDSRIALAVGTRLHLVDGSNNPRSATAGEIKQMVIDQMTLLVLEEEQAAAKKTAAAGVTPITPT